MSHRTHHGPLSPQRTERAFPEPAAWAVLALAAVCLAVALAGCAHTTASYVTTAGLPPPYQPAGGASAPDPTTRPPPLSYPPPGQASCSMTAQFSNWSLFRNYDLNLASQHTNADGTIDTSTAGYGSQTDTQGLGIVAGTLGSVAGLLAKGAVTAGTGGAVPMTAIPQRDGTYKLVPAQPQPPPRAFGPASAAGCIPALGGPGVNAGPPLAPFAASRTPAAADPLAPGWHQGVTGTRRDLLAADGGRVAYRTPSGALYGISEAAWFAWLGQENVP